MLKLNSLRLAKQLVVVPQVINRFQSTLPKSIHECPGPKRTPLLGNFLNFKTGMEEPCTGCYQHWLSVPGAN